MILNTSVFLPTPWNPWALPVSSTLSTWSWMCPFGSISTGASAILPGRPCWSPKWSASPLSYPVWPAHSRQRGLRKMSVSSHHSSAPNFDFLFIFKENWNQEALFDLVLLLPSTSTLLQPDWPFSYSFSALGPFPPQLSVHVSPLPSSSLRLPPGLSERRVLSCLREALPHVQLVGSPTLFIHLMVLMTISNHICSFFALLESSSPVKDVNPWTHLSCSSSFQHTKVWMGEGSRSVWWLSVLSQGKSERLFYWITQLLEESCYSASTDDPHRHPCSSFADVYV